MERMPLSDTREIVDEEWHYLYFDMAIDGYQNGQYDFAEAIKRYQLMLGAVVLDKTAERPS